MAISVCFSMSGYVSYVFNGTNNLFVVYAVSGPVYSLVSSSQRTPVKYGGEFGFLLDNPNKLIKFMLNCCFFPSLSVQNASLKLEKNNEGEFGQLRAK